MADQQEDSSILNYETPGAGEPGPPFVFGRRLGLLSALLPLAAVALPFITKSFQPPMHLTFYCGGGMLSLGILVGICGVVMDRRSDAAALAMTLNTLLFTAMVCMYPGAFDDH